MTKMFTCLQGSPSSRGLWWHFRGNPAHSSPLAHLFRNKQERWLGSVMDHFKQLLICKLDITHLECWARFPSSPWIITAFERYPRALHPTFTLDSSSTIFAMALQCLAIPCYTTVILRCITREVIVARLPLTTGMMVAFACPPNRVPRVTS